MKARYQSGLLGYSGAEVCWGFPPVRIRLVMLAEVVMDQFYLIPGAIAPGEGENRPQHLRFLQKRNEVLHQPALKNI